MLAMIGLAFAAAQGSPPAAATLPEAAAQSLPEAPIELDPFVYPGTSKLPARVPAVTAERAAAAFERLKTFAGEWRIKDKPASPLRIRFALTAGDTVLVESWERDGKPLSMTLYHRDGAMLIATHYCAQGNQPRLALAPVAVKAGPIKEGSVKAEQAQETLRFSYMDATDLDAGEGYLVSLAFQPEAGGTLVRRERYRQGKVNEPESVLRLERVNGLTALSSPSMPPPHRQ